MSSPLKKMSPSLRLRRARPASWPAALTRRCCFGCVPANQVPQQWATAALQMVSAVRPDSTRGNPQRSCPSWSSHSYLGLGICQNDVKWCKMKRIFGGVEFWAISVLFFGKLWDLDARGSPQKDLRYNDSVYQRHPTPRHDLCRLQTDGQSPLEHWMKATKRAFQKVKDLTRPELLWLYTMGLSQHLELSIPSHG